MLEGSRRVVMSLPAVWASWIESQSLAQHLDGVLFLILCFWFFLPPSLFLTLNLLLTYSLLAFQDKYSDNFKNKLRGGRNIRRGKRGNKGGNKREKRKHDFLCIGLKIEDQHTVFIKKQLNSWDNTQTQVCLP